MRKEVNDIELICPILESIKKYIIHSDVETNDRSNMNSGADNEGGDDDGIDKHTENIIHIVVLKQMTGGT